MNSKQNKNFQKLCPYKINTIDRSFNINKQYSISSASFLAAVTVTAKAIAASAQTNRESL